MWVDLFVPSTTIYLVRQNDLLVEEVGMVSSAHRMLSELGAVSDPHKASLMANGLKMQILLLLRITLKTYDLNV